MKEKIYGKLNSFDFDPDSLVMNSYDDEVEEMASPDDPVYDYEVEDLASPDNPVYDDEVDDMALPDNPTYDDEVEMAEPDNPNYDSLHTQEIDEGLLEVLENNETIFDIDNTVDDPVLSFLDGNEPEDLLLNETKKIIDNPFQDPKQVRAQDEQIQKQKELKERLSSEIVKNGKHVEDEEEIKSESEEEISIEQLLGDIELKKEDKRKRLQEISQKIMAEPKKKTDLAVGAGLSERNLKNIDSPFLQIESNGTLKESLMDKGLIEPSPFNDPKEKMNNKAGEDNELKQTPIIIKNIQPDNGELKKELSDMAKNVESLSEIVEPIKKMNSIFGSSNFGKDKFKISIDDENKPIICDVCGHVNKQGTVLCEMCSNYLTNTNRR